MSDLPWLGQPVGDSSVKAKVYRHDLHRHATMTKAAGVVQAFLDVSVGVLEEHNKSGGLGG
jgi:hypothetical protein